MNTQTMEFEDKRIGGEDHIAPWWMGYLFLLPIRHFYENPKRILENWIDHDDTVFELGPAMGWFTLELARQAGPGGWVICSEVQQKMLDGLDRRLRRAGLRDRVELRRCASDDPCIDDLRDRVDFILLHNVIHEVDHPARVLHKAATALREGGRVYLCEPNGHVKDEDFDWEEKVLKDHGLRELARPKVRGHRVVVLGRPRR